LAFVWVNLDEMGPQRSKSPTLRIAMPRAEFLDFNVHGDLIAFCS